MAENNFTDTQQLPYAAVGATWHDALGNSVLDTAKGLRFATQFLIVQSALSQHGPTTNACASIPAVAIVACSIAAITTEVA